MSVWVRDSKTANVRREVGRALPIVTCIIVGVVTLLALPRLKTPAPKLETLPSAVTDASRLAIDSLVAVLPDQAPQPNTQRIAESDLEDIGASPTRSAPRSVVTGKVTDSAGNPVEDARITLVRSDLGDCPRARYARFCNVVPVGRDGCQVRSDENGRFESASLDGAADFDVFVDLEGENLWWLDSCALPLAQVQAGESNVEIQLPYGIIAVTLDIGDSLTDIHEPDGSIGIEVGVERGVDQRDSIRGLHSNRLRIVAPFDQAIDIVIGGRGLREVRQSSVSVAFDQGTVPLEIALEPERSTGRILVSVVDENMLPVRDAWLHKVTAFDPPAFEYVRVGEGSDSKQGFFVLDGLEPREYTICALGESYGDRAPAFGSVDVVAGESRELLLMLCHGEYLEVTFRSNMPELEYVALIAPDLDYEIGDILEWSLAQRSSFGTYRSFEAGESYRSSIRVPLGTYQLKLRDASGKDWSQTVEVEDGRVARISVGLDR